MSNSDFDRWMKIAEWRGESVRALEDIEKELKEIKMDIKKIREHNRDRDWKTAYIAGGMAIIVSIITLVLSFMMNSVL